MSSSRIPLVLALLAGMLAAVPAASAQGRDQRVVRVQGVCTQESTSKLKLSREDRGIEVEFEVDQNRNSVPWNVTLRRNGTAVVSFTATTRAPSGSFEIHRVIAGRLGISHITVAARAQSETCTAAASALSAKRAAVDGTEAGDDHGRHSGGHS